MDADDYTVNANGGKSNFNAPNDVKAATKNIEDAWRKTGLKISLNHRYSNLREKKEQCELGHQDACLRIKWIQEGIDEIEAALVE